MKSQRAFGETLKKHREQAGISLESIAKKTKVSASLFAGLERGDCSRWPAGIYSRAYIRDYAQAIGLDPDDVAEQFSRCFTGVAFPEGAPDVAVKAPPPQMPTAPLRMKLEPDPDAAVKTAVRRAVFIVLDSLLIAAVGSLLWVALVPNFWMAFSLAAIACHTLTLSVGGRSAVGLIDESHRPATDASETSESAVIEPA